MSPLPKLIVIIAVINECLLDVWCLASPALHGLDGKTIQVLLCQINYTILKFYIKLLCTLLLSNTNINYFVECNKPVKKTSSLNSEAKGKSIYCCQVIGFKALPHVE